MRTRSRKLTALFFLVILSAETLVPGAAYALTSGPAQPEMQQFQPAGASDMVDLFTGDLKYNIPLGDVDGYPLNLAYRSGTGLEDEAGWVGAGWSLNPGAITRDMRGLPDDFNGERVSKEYDRKPFKKVGARLYVKGSMVGWEVGKGGLHMGVYRDNYYGIGAEVGASLSMHLAQQKKTTLTAGLGVTSDTRDGVSISPSFSISREHDIMEDFASRSLSGSLLYNSRNGMRQNQLNASYSSGTTWLSNHLAVMQFSATKYFGQSYTPSLRNNTVNNGYTLSYDGGITAFGLYLGPGASGYFYTERIADKVSSAPAYGYMNYLSGRNNLNALLDFNREKDGVFLPSAPSIPIPVATQDFFSATSQAGSIQFRPHFGGNYVVFDKAHYNNTNNLKAGATVGVGNVKKSGGRLEFTTGGTNTNKWTKNNEYLDVAEAPFSVNSSPAESPFYFKASGELTQVDEEYFGKIKDEKIGQVALTDGSYFKGPRTRKIINTRGQNDVLVGEPADVMKKVKPEKRTSAISALTAAQAARYGLDKTINGEPRDQGPQGMRKSHHLSEITITDDQGKRIVYGIPVYNKEKKDVMFSVGRPYAGYEDKRREGTVTYAPNAKGKPNYHVGRDELYSKETVPSYATSFLLTGILSPDYVDLKGDGITDDDLGTAIKFKYEKLTGDYQWRAPYAANSANYNEGFVSDPLDDKGSYVYGKKEIWNLSSIESKTMIAIFETSPREDGMGVAGEHGDRGGPKLKKLDRIKIYSRADWVRNQTLATPVKVIHFEYDYSLFPQVPNNSQARVPSDLQSPDLNASHGKLTLRKVYFTFGTSKRGVSNPYEFEYDMRLVRDLENVPYYNGAAVSETDNKEKDDLYAARQQDSWGTYKQSRYNSPLTDRQSAQVKLNNSEFPYTIQENDNTTLDERELANRYASKWQLVKIETPTGGTINIQYEADDYAYVQNRRAMQMCFVDGIGDGLGNGVAGLATAKGLTVRLPKEVPGISAAEQEKNFRNMYLKQADGTPMKFLFFKIYCKLNEKNVNEFVQGYAELDGEVKVSTDRKTAFLRIKGVGKYNYNPIARAAWQMMKTDLPQYFYDDYDNSGATSISDNFSAAIKSLARAIGNLGELGSTFERIGFNKRFANQIDPSKSMVRLCSPLGFKIGGGARVRRVTMSDNWQAMAGPDAKNASLGQEYTYTTLSDEQKMISSGVASYEPSMGAEENPFHQPVPYTEVVHRNADRYHFIELPYCETYFPAPVVGYSKVTVTSLGGRDILQGGTPAQHAGFTENEFYTAREFPTLVDNMPLEQNKYENKMIVRLFSSTYVQRVSTSQGFKVELNDMHGKPKSVKVFGQGRKEISSVVNYYNVGSNGALNNLVDIMQPDGVVIQKQLGTDIDIATDVRESNNESVGSSVGAYVGSMIIPTPFTFFKIPYAAINFNYSYTAESYNSISAVKVVHKFGILKKVTTTQNGSSLTVENTLWDGETGNVLLTRIQNEFNDYNYAFTYPAHMAEKGMAGAYDNLGTMFMDFAVPSNGVVPSQLKGRLFPGDELGALDEDKKVWVISSSNGPDDLRLIDSRGTLVGASGRYMILRSGRRNLTAASVGTVVCMNDPVAKQSDGTWKLELGVDKKILDAKAVYYNNKWAAPVGQQMRPVRAVPKPELCPGTCLNDFLLGALIKVHNTGSTGTRRGLISLQADNVRIKDLVQKYDSRPDCNTLFDPGGVYYQSRYYLLNPHTATLADGSTRFEIQAGDIAQFGDIQIVFDEVHPEFNDLLNSSMSEEAMRAHLNQNNGVGGTMSYCMVPESFDDMDEYSGDWADLFCKEKLVFRKIFNCTQPQRWNCDIEHCSNTKLLKWHVTAPPQNAEYVDDCVDPTSTTINPYVTGLLGNWRPQYPMTYAVDRVQQPALSYQNGGTNVRYSGYYKEFEPFWIFSPSTQSLQPAFQPEPNDQLNNLQRWIWAAKSVYYDARGNEVESVVPLPRKVTENGEQKTVYASNSVLFGYRESVATAVASNARHNEIAFDGFEDYGFELQSKLKEECPSPRHFDWGFTKSGNSWCAGSNCITSERAHTGKYSLKVSSIMAISTQAGGWSAPSDFLYINGQGQYQIRHNELAGGFRPIPDKKYLLSFWVYDNAPTSDKPALTLRLNGEMRAVSNMIVPVVEEWKLVQIEFTAGSSFDLQFWGTNYFIDDLRILPVDGHLTSFVYDDVTMRLMAQLDENNFATFYEYDEEGTPIRVKKETERGIMTIKENRQFFRKRN